MNFVINIVDISFLNNHKFGNENFSKLRLFILATNKHKVISIRASLNATEDEQQSHTLLPNPYVILLHILSLQCCHIFFMVNLYTFLNARFKKKLLTFYPLQTNVKNNLS